MRKIALSIILVSVLALSLAGCVDTPRAAPNATFAELSQNKAAYFQSQYDIMDNYLFQDGTVIYYNSSGKTQVAMVTSLPLKKGELTDNDYIAVRVYSPLNIGDTINVEGMIKKARHNESEIYYLDSRNTVVTGKIDASDPDFQGILRSIAQKEKNNNDSLFITEMIMIVYLNPISPLSPFNTMYDD